MSAAGRLVSAAEGATLPLAPAVQWSFNPWREAPARAAATAVVALALCFVILAWREAMVLSAALCVAAVAALSPALTPLECRVDEDGIARRGPLGWERRRWSDIRRAVLGRRGLLVSPYTSPHWLDETRGLRLPLPAATGATLSPAIATMLRRHGL
jgi:hypothetical protein